MTARGGVRSVTGSRRGLWLEAGNGAWLQHRGGGALMWPVTGQAPRLFSRKDSVVDAQSSHLLAGWPVLKVSARAAQASAERGTEPVRRRSLQMNVSCQCGTACRNVDTIHGQSANSHRARPSRLKILHVCQASTPLRAGLNTSAA